MIAERLECITTINGSILNGKTIKNYLQTTEELIIIFTDNTILYLQAYSPDDAEVQLDVECSLWVLHLEKSQAVELGICTEQEYDVLYRQYEDRCTNNAVQRRREEYEKLKKELQKLE